MSEILPSTASNIERVARAIDPMAWTFIDAHENDVPEHPAVELTRANSL